MRRGVDYYAVLGVARNATADELRRRYRQLVRSHHPDVADDQEAAHERFIVIVEAYRVLSDPARRRAYDALQSQAPPPLRTMSQQVQEQIDDWFRHAVHRLENNDLNGAAAQARKILALDPTHAAAQALLGDVHAHRDEWDDALVFYSGAVSAAPRNPAYARKLRAAAESGQQARAAEERRRHLAEQRRRAIEALNAKHEFTPYAVVIGAAWLVVLVAWLLRHPGPPPDGWFPLPRHTALAATGLGAATGLLLALSQTARFEVAPRPTDRLAWAAFGLLAIAQFYAALAGFLVVSLLRERLQPALSLAFAAAFVWVLALAGIQFSQGEPPDRLWLVIAAWSGNLVFPALVVGHQIGRWLLAPLPD